MLERVEELNNFLLIFTYLFAVSILSPLSLRFFSLLSRGIALAICSFLLILSGCSLDSSIWQASALGSYHSVLIFAYYWQIYFAFLLIENARGGGYLEQFGVTSVSNQAYLSGIKLAIFCYIFNEWSYGEIVFDNSVLNQELALLILEDLQLLLEQSFSLVAPIIISFILVELVIFLYSLLVKNHSFWLESYLSKILVLLICTKQMY